jgi:hypothetical protein
VRTLLAAANANDHDRFAQLTRNVELTNQYGPPPSTALTIRSVLPGPGCDGEPRVSVRDSRAGNSQEVDVHWNCADVIGYHAWTFLVRDGRIIGAAEVPGE